MKRFVKDVVDKATRAHITKAHESQWRLVVIKILLEIESWQEKKEWELLDV